MNQLALHWVKNLAELMRCERVFGITGIGVFMFWNLFTLAGALGAQAMGDMRAVGLDSAVPAAFLGLVWPTIDRKF
jgi:predicted branched-subunit amino acid permease